MKGELAVQSHYMHSASLKRGEFWNADVRPYLARVGMAMTKEGIVIVAKTPKV